MSSSPQPLYQSRPSGQRRHPVAALTSAAECSSTDVTWSGVRVGLAANSSAAAAVTCAAAYDVPSAGRNSGGPQIEYPWSTHVGRFAVSVRGSVEPIPTPGAAMSCETLSRIEKTGTEPSGASALTPITCGKAAG